MATAWLKTPLKSQSAPVSSWHMGNTAQNGRDPKYMYAWWDLPSVVHTANQSRVIAPNGHLFSHRYPPQRTKMEKQNSSSTQLCISPKENTSLRSTFLSGTTS